MIEFTIISEKFRALRDLANKQIIFVDDLPIEFKADLQNYIMGQTLSMRDGKLVVGNNLYKRWLGKIRTKGFDYEIDFRK